MNSILKGEDYISTSIKGCKDFEAIKTKGIRVIVIGIRVKLVIIISGIYIKNYISIQVSLDLLIYLVLKLWEITKM